MLSQRFGIVFSLFVCSLSFAQKQRYDYFVNEFGLSINHTFIRSPYYTITTSPGFGASIYRSYRETKPVRFAIGAEYNHTGFQVDSIAAGINYYLKDVRYSLNQVNIPILLRWHVGKKQCFYFEAGSSLGLIIKSKIIQTVHTSYFPSQDSVYRRITDGEGFVTCFTIGSGFRIPLNSGALLVKCDLVKGLDKIVYREGSYSTKPFPFNSYVRLMGIYQLPIKG